MKITITRDAWTDEPLDLLIVAGNLQDATVRSRLSGAEDALWDALLQERGLEECGWTRLLYGWPGTRAHRVLLVSATGCTGRYDRLRKNVLVALRGLKVRHLSRVGLACLNAESGDDWQVLIEAVHLATEDLGSMKTQEPDALVIEEVFLFSSEISRDMCERVAWTMEGVNLARRLTNLPGNRTSPRELAEIARQVAQDGGLECVIWDEAALARDGFGAVLAVGGGSPRPPRLVSLTYRGDPERPERIACLIGKGIVFDAGGISLKPAQSMEEMKADKAGACAVLGAMHIVGRLKPRCNVAALVPLAENLPDGRAQRPGDVIRTYSGRTVEVINTDAEGRLLLADVLGYADAVLKPSWIADLATLTGACVVALGHVRAGYFANRESLASAVETAASKARERIWRLPLDVDYFEELKSPIADVRNVGSRWGGAVTAAKFLEFFAGERPWCHIDMAGMDMFDDKRQELGPSGFGTLTLVHLVERFAEEDF
ncbi:MAG TPA: leucyl aminopeptidase [Acidobacteriota bacterium]|nr:leucyl aminopeptidase [Acidobacteriota bacterium]